MSKVPNLRNRSLFLCDLHRNCKKVCSMPKTFEPWLAYSSKFWPDFFSLAFVEKLKYDKILSNAFFVLS